MGNDGSKASAAPRVESAKTILLLATNEGMLGPVKEEAGMMASLFGKSEPIWRPRLQPQERVTTSSFACITSYRAHAPAGEGVKFGDAVFVRFNFDRGCIMRVDPKSGQLSITGSAPDDSCALVLVSAAGKAPGEFVAVGDWVSFQVVQSGAMLTLGSAADKSGFTELEAGRRGVAAAVFALAPPPQAPVTTAPVPGADIDANIFAAAAVGAAGALLTVDPSGKVLNQAATAAAPHVQRAATERYSGKDGGAKMMSDAGTAYNVGKAVADNPAARAAGAALFSAAASGAMAAMQSKQQKR